MEFASLRHRDIPSGRIPPARRVWARIVAFGASPSRSNRTIRRPLGFLRCYDQETPRIDETPDRSHEYGAIGLFELLATTVDANVNVAEESAESAA